MKKIGFIGAGAMGGMLLAAARAGIAGEDIVFAEPSDIRAREIAETYGCLRLPSNEKVAEQAETLMLCVKPQIAEAVLAEIIPVLKRNYDMGIRQTLGTIVASRTLVQFDEQLGKSGLELPVIRMLPNTPVAVGEGVILFAGNSRCVNGEVAALMELLKGAGLCREMPEEGFDPACPVFSCSPAFVYMFIESLADGGVQVGMTREEATVLAAQATLGSAAMVLRSGLHIGQLKDQLSTPGGMTIAGTNLMETMGFRGAVSAGIVRAFQRGREF